MSRFSRAEAESKGWVFYHEREEHSLNANPGRGISRLVPATLRAEKYVSLPGQAASLIREEGETEGLLLERISQYEAHLERVSPKPQPARYDEADELRVVSRVGEDADGVGEPVRSVIVSADPEDLSEGGEVRYLTEAEWAARDGGDTLVVRNDDGDAELVRFSGPTEDAQSGLDAKEARENAVENARAAEEEFEGKQVVLNPADVSPDSPGATGTGTLRIREDEEVGDVAERHEHEGADREDARVQGQVEGGFVKHVPEDLAALAGVDVGIQAESDLESDIPPVGAIEGSTEFTGGEEAEVHGPTAEAAAEGRQAMEDAIVEARDEDLEDGGIAEATSDESEKEALSAGLEAQVESDESQADDEEDAEGDDLNATKAAIDLAAEKGIDLSEVEGSGKDGRIVKSDVEAASDDE